MLLSQQLGISTLNGYSAVQPDGYQAPFSCQQMPQRIVSYMSWAGIYDLTIYQDILERVVPIGFEDCETDIWKNAVLNRGEYSQSTFSQTQIVVRHLSPHDGKIRVELEINNPSTEAISWLSLTNNDFRMACRYIEVGDSVQNVAWNVRFDISEDILPGESKVFIYEIDPPESQGAYLLQITALQENVGWFHERGFQIPSSA